MKAKGFLMNARLHCFLKLEYLINPTRLHFRVILESFLNQLCRRSSYQRDFRTDQLLSLMLLMSIARLSPHVFYKLPRNFCVREKRRCGSSHVGPLL